VTGGHATEKAKMLAGELYRADDRQIMAERNRAKRLCGEYNRVIGEPDRRILASILGVETDAWFEPPFYCDFGCNLRVGRGVFANHNLIVLDCNIVTIGDNVQIAPNVVLSTATHPIDPEVRRSGLEMARPITIGDNVWLGAGVIVLPDVSIGDNTTVGAGSVVTRSLPANCVAYGNPCRIVRDLSGEARPIRDRLLDRSD
jgi:maltose O-acetyltransferase